MYFRKNIQNMRKLTFKTKFVINAIFITKSKSYRRRFSSLILFFYVRIKRVYTLFIKNIDF